MNQLFESSDLFGLVLGQIETREEQWKAIKQLQLVSSKVCEKANEFLVHETIAGRYTCNLTRIDNVPHWFRVNGRNATLVLYEPSQNSTCMLVHPIEPFLCVSSLNMKFDQPNNACADFASWFPNLKTIVLVMNCDLNWISLPRTLTTVTVQGLGSIRNSVRWMDTANKNGERMWSYSPLHNFTKFVMPLNTNNGMLPFAKATTQYAQLVDELAVNVAHADQALKIISNRTIQSRVVSLSINHHLTYVCKVGRWKLPLPNLRSLLVRENQFRISNTEVLFPHVEFVSVLGFSPAHMHEMLSDISFQCANKVSTLHLNVISMYCETTAVYNTDINTLFPNLEHLVVHDSVFREPNSLKLPFGIDNLMIRPTKQLSLCVINWIRSVNIVLLYTMLRLNRFVNTLHHLCIMSKFSGINLYDVLDAMPVSVRHLNISTCSIAEDNWCWLQSLPFHRLQQLKSINVGIEDPCTFVKYATQLTAALRDVDQVVFRINFGCLMFTDELSFIVSMNEFICCDKAQDTRQSIRQKLHKSINSNTITLESKQLFVCRKLLTCVTGLGVQLFLFYDLLCQLVDYQPTLNENNYLDGCQSTSS